MLKLIKSNWIKFCIIAIVWNLVIFVISNTPAREIIKHISFEGWLSIILTIVTTGLAALTDIQKRRSQFAVDERNKIKELIQTNQETLISGLRALEDIIDSIRLEMQQFEVVGLRMSAIESESDLQKSEHYKLVSEVHRLDERIRQGDRLLKALNIIGGLINDVAEVRTHLGVKSSLDFSPDVPKRKPSTDDG
jgi:hypothetical protein